MTDLGSSHSRAALGNMRQCSCCLYDETIPLIDFDEHGVCNYCRTYRAMDEQHPTDARGEEILQTMAREIREAGRGKKYDCIVGVSGGCDSSYLIWKAVQLGLRPLAVHFDNTWNSPIATQNIHNVLQKLGVDLYTKVWSNREADDLFRAFMLAGVREIEAPTDIGFAATLYEVAAKHGIGYVLEGHSFRTEGFTPPGLMYLDGAYIQDVHKKFGRIPLKTFPNLTLPKFLKYITVNNVKRLRPLFWVDYNKERVKEFLSEELGWQWYGGHHLENRMTVFFHNYWLPRRYGTDLRIVAHSALVRSGQLPRDQAARQVAEPISCDPELVDMVKKRLGFTDDEFVAVVTAPKKTHEDYRTYKQTFRRLRPLFWLLYKQGRVPESFYKKFCEGTAN